METKSLAFVDFYKSLETLNDLNKYELLVMKAFIYKVIHIARCNITFQYFRLVLFFIELIMGNIRYNM